MYAIYEWCCSSNLWIYRGNVQEVLWWFNSMLISPQKLSIFLTLPLTTFNKSKINLKPFNRVYLLETLWWKHRHLQAVMTWVTWLSIKNIPLFWNVLNIIHSQCWEWSFSVWMTQVTWHKVLCMIKTNLFPALRQTNRKIIIEHVPLQRFEERARNTASTFINGITEFERLEGSQHEHADWHAKLTLCRFFCILFKIRTFLLLAAPLCCIRYAGVCLELSWFLEVM